MEELKIGRKDQREGRASRRHGASDDRDADAVQRTLCLLEAVPVGLVVEMGEVYGVIDRHAHDHHDEDPRDCDTGQQREAWACGSKLGASSL